MEAIEKKGIALNPQAQTHYIDHLAVVCVAMDIPLLFIDEQDYNFGNTMYPGLNAQQEEFQNLNPEYLIARYDVLFMSDLWDRRTFHQKYAPLEKKYKKQLRHVHCPHGFSDKGFYLMKCANEDITLIYGQNMLDQLKHHGVFEHLNEYVISGNMRYSYYQQHKQFYDNLVQQLVFQKLDKSKPTILYAPTWLDLEESTSFFDAYQEIIGSLPDDYNLIVKLHPRLELDDNVRYYQIIGKYENKPNILFLKDFPLVYPLLAHTSIYIGDMSSVGYDFLAFNKPMFFLNKQQRDSQFDRGLYLFRCGVEIKPEDFSQLYQIIEKNIPLDKQFHSLRKEVYDYTFGKERPFADIKADIIRAYNKPLILNHEGMIK
jgi:CDP-glycerol glycerophosphotransferase (TagB/SpsB family)